MPNDQYDIPEQFTEWANLGDIPGTPNENDRELLEELNPWVTADQIRVERTNQQFFDVLESRYPIVSHRINWNELHGHLAFDVLPRDSKEMDGEEHREKLACCRAVLLEWFDSNDIDSKEQVVWIGDASNLSIHMRIGTLLQCYPFIFSWPQHHYVMPSTGEWCLNYTMEGQLFFGTGTRT